MAVPAITNRGRQINLESMTTAAVAGPATMLLVGSAHSFTSIVDFVSSISADEIVATDYVRELATFGTLTVLDSGTVYIPIEPTVFSAIGGAVNATVTGCYMFHDTGDDATSPLIACVPFQTPKSTDGTDFRVTWPLETMTSRPPIL